MSGPTPEPDHGLFGPDSVTWRVHGDPAMAVAGFRALLLQAVHPLVIAGFDANSGWRGDPWGRLERTGRWIATVTYGTTAEAEDAGEVLRRLHRRLSPVVDPETGRSVRVDDPELLTWVHCTEVESFLSTYRRCGGTLSDAEADRYVAEMTSSARLVGLDPAAVPTSVSELHSYYSEVRPALKVTPVARRNVLRSFVPPMPRKVALLTPARPAWIGLLTLASAMLPPWTRRLYGLPGIPSTDLTATVLGRSLRGALAVVPQDLVRSPAHREALSRVEAAA